MRTLPISSKVISFNHSFRSNEDQPIVTKAPISEVVKPEDNKKEKLAKAVPYATAALAVASLGISLYATRGRGKTVANPEIKPNEVLEKQLKEHLDKIKTLETELAGLKTKLQNNSGNVGNLENLVEKSELSPLQNRINELENYIKILKKGSETVKVVSNMFTDQVVVNGEVYTVATNLGGLRDDIAHQMKKDLQAESTKRILGAGIGWDKVPEKGMIRIPTAEIRPFSSTGGMSIVPKEIANNLAKHLAGHKEMQVVVDSPLYLGRADKESFYQLKRMGNSNKYEYIRKSFDEKGKLKEKGINKLGILEDIGSMTVPIHTDTGKTTETVRLLKAEKLEKLDFNQIRQSMTQDTFLEMNKVIAEGKPFETKGLIISPVANSPEAIAKGEPKFVPGEAHAKVKYVFYDHPKFYLDIRRCVIHIW